MALTKSEAVDLWGQYRYGPDWDIDGATGEGRRTRIKATRMLMDAISAESTRAERKQLSPVFRQMLGDAGVQFRVGQKATKEELDIGSKGGLGGPRWVQAIGAGATQHSITGALANKVIGSDELATWRPEGLGEELIFGGAGLASNLPEFIGAGLLTAPAKAARIAKTGIQLAQRGGKSAGIVSKALGWAPIISPVPLNVAARAAQWTHQLPGIKGAIEGGQALMKTKTLPGALARFAYKPAHSGATLGLHTAGSLPALSLINEGELPDAGEWAGQVGKSALLGALGGSLGALGGMVPKVGKVLGPGLEMGTFAVAPAVEAGLSPIGPDSGKFWGTAASSGLPLLALSLATKGATLPVRAPRLPGVVVPADKLVKTYTKEKAALMGRINAITQRDNDAALEDIPQRIADATTKGDQAALTRWTAALRLRENPEELRQLNRDKQQLNLRTEQLDALAEKSAAYAKGKPVSSKARMIASEGGVNLLGGVATKETERYIIGIKYARARRDEAQAVLDELNQAGADPKDIAAAAKRVDDAQRQIRAFQAKRNELLQRVPEERQMSAEQQLLQDVVRTQEPQGSAPPAVEGGSPIVPVIPGAYTRADLTGVSEGTRPPVPLVRKSKAEQDYVRPQTEEAPEPTGFTGALIDANRINAILDAPPEEKPKPTDVAELQKQLKIDIQYHTQEAQDALIEGFDAKIAELTGTLGDKTKDKARKRELAEVAARKAAAEAVASAAAPAAVKAGRRVTFVGKDGKQTEGVVVDSSAETPPGQLWVEFELTNKKGQKEKRTSLIYQSSADRPAKSNARYIIKGLEDEPPAAAPAAAEAVAPVPPVPPAAPEAAAPVPPVPTAAAPTSASVLPRFKKGDKVRHHYAGTGTVQKSTAKPDKNGEYSYFIKWDDPGTRTGTQLERTLQLVGEEAGVTPETSPTPADPKSVRLAATAELEETLRGLLEGLNDKIVSIGKLNPEQALVQGEVNESLIAVRRLQLAVERGETADVDAQYDRLARVSRDLQIRAERAISREAAAPVVEAVEREVDLEGDLEADLLEARRVEYADEVQQVHDDLDRLDSARERDGVIKGYWKGKKPQPGQLLEEWDGEEENWVSVTVDQVLPGRVVLLKGEQKPRKLHKLRPIDAAEWSPPDVELLGGEAPQPPKPAEQPQPNPYDSEYVGIDWLDRAAERGYQNRRKYGNWGPGAQNPNEGIPVEPQPFIQWMAGESAILARRIIRQGLEFKDWAIEMRQAFGDAVNKHLELIWDNAQDYLQRRGGREKEVLAHLDDAVAARTVEEGYNERLTAAKREFDETTAFLKTVVSWPYRSRLDDTAIGSGNESAVPNPRHRLQASDAFKRRERAESALSAVELKLQMLDVLRTLTNEELQQDGRQLRERVYRERNIRVLSNSDIEDVARSLLKARGVAVESVQTTAETRKRKDELKAIVAEDAASRAGRTDEWRNMPGPEARDAAKKLYEIEQHETLLRELTDEELQKAYRDAADAAASRRRLLAAGNAFPDVHRKALREMQDAIGRIEAEQKRRATASSPEEAQPTDRLAPRRTRGSGSVQDTTTKDVSAAEQPQGFLDTEIAKANEHFGKTELRAGITDKDIYYAGVAIVGHLRGLVRSVAHAYRVLVDVLGEARAKLFRPHVNDVYAQAQRLAREEIARQQREIEITDRDPARSDQMLEEKIPEEKPDNAETTEESVVRERPEVKFADWPIERLQDLAERMNFRVKDIVDRINTGEIESTDAARATLARYEQYIREVNDLIDLRQKNQTYEDRADREQAAREAGDTLDDTKPATFRVNTYDVWGNTEDGYSVNDVFERESIDIQIPPAGVRNWDERVVAELKRVGWLDESTRPSDIRIEGESGDTLYITDERDGKPLFELRREEQREEATDTLPTRDEWVADPDDPLNQPRESREELDRTNREQDEIMRRNPDGRLNQADRARYDALEEHKKQIEEYNRALLTYGDWSYVDLEYQLETLMRSSPELRNRPHYQAHMAALRKLIEERYGSLDNPRQPQPQSEPNQRERDQRERDQQAYDESVELKAPALERILDSTAEGPLTKLTRRPGEKPAEDFSMWLTRADRVAQEKLREAANSLNSTPFRLDLVPHFAVRMVKLGYEGYRTAKDIVKRLAEEYGPGVRAYLKDAWELALDLRDQAAGRLSTKDPNLGPGAASGGGDDGSRRISRGFKRTDESGSPVGPTAPVGRPVRVPALLPSTRDTTGTGGGTGGGGGTAGTTGAAPGGPPGRPMTLAQAKAEIKAAQIPSTRLIDELKGLKGVDLVLKTRKHSVDDIYRFLQVERLLQGKRPNQPGDDLPVDVSFHKKARMSRASAEMVDVMLESHMLDYADPTSNAGLGMEAILKPIREAGRLDDFKEMLLAGTVMDRVGRGMDTPFSKDAARVVYDAGMRDSLLKRAAEQFQEFNEGYLTYLKDAGYIDQRAQDAITAANKHYLPLYRLMDRPDAPTVGSHLAERFANAPGLARAKGSKRPLSGDPLMHYVSNVYAGVKLANRNAAAAALVKLWEAAPDALKQTVMVERTKEPDWFKGISADDLATTLGYKPDELINLLGEGDTTLGKARLDAIARVYRPDTLLGPQRNQRVLSVIVDGKRRYFDIVDKELYEAFVSLSRQQLPALIKWASWIPRLLRYTAVTHPAFALANVGRDTQGAAIASKSGFIPVASTVIGIAHVLGKSKEYRELQAAGGGMSTIRSFARAGMSKKQAQMLVGKGIAAGAKGEWQRLKTMSITDAVAEFVKHDIPGFSHLLGLFEGIAEVSERGTRVGEYLAAKKKFIKKGMTPAAAARQAAWESRDLIDFLAAGYTGRVLNQMIPFWNAGVQGIDKTGRTLLTDEGTRLGTWMRMGALTTLATALWVVNANDPRWANETVASRAANFIIMPPWDKNAPPIRIPKPPAYSIVASELELFLDQMKERDPRFWDKARQIFLTGTVPEFMPQSLLLVQEITAGKGGWSHYRDQPIVPRHLQGLNAEEQYDEATSELAKHMGRAAGWSPKKIDYVISQTLSGLGQQWLVPGVEKVLGMQDWLSPLVRDENKIPPPAANTPVVGRFLSRATQGSSQIVEDFYRTREELTKQVNTINSRAKKIRELPAGPRREKLREEFVALRQAEAGKIRTRSHMDKVAKELADYRQQIRAVGLDTSIPYDERRRRMDALYRESSNLAKRALQDARKAL